jgi:hypothetical protein
MCAFSDEPFSGGRYHLRRQEEGAGDPQTFFAYEILSKT